MRRGSRGSARGGPGLLRTVGRTTVIAGTATAVSRGVSGAMDAAAQQQAPPPADAPVAGGADRIAMLQQLGELRAQGVLTDAEFEAEKARVLAS